MVQVKVLKSKADNLYGLEVKGHAGYAEAGQDLVCAAVSSIITGGFNAMSKEDIEEIALEEGYAKVILKENTHSVEVLKVIVIQLQTIEESYPKFIKLK